MKSMLLYVLFKGEVSYYYLKALIYHTAYSRTRVYQRHEVIKVIRYSTFSKLKTLLMTYVVVSPL